MIGGKCRHCDRRLVVVVGGSVLCRCLIYIVDFELEKRGEYVCAVSFEWVLLLKRVCADFLMPFGVAVDECMMWYVLYECKSQITTSCVYLRCDCMFWLCWIYRAKLGYSTRVLSFFVCSNSWFTFCRPVSSASAHKYFIVSLRTTTQQTTLYTLHYMYMHICSLKLGLLFSAFKNIYMFSAKLTAFENNLLFPTYHIVKYYRSLYRRATSMWM